MDLARPDRRARLDELAAQYALGTLRGRARARFARAMRADPVVADAAREWDDRLASLASALPGVTPPPRVWTGIATRLGLATAAPVSGTWWQGIGFWRAFGLASFAAAVILSIVTLGGPVAPVGERVVVVLAGADARPAMIATAARGDPVLTMKTVAQAAPGPGRTFQLWALPDGGAPQSLGVIPPGGVVRVPLRGPARDLLDRVPTLAVSLEPTGGSPTGQPTGPVLYTGRVERFD
ncbi:MAG TPA: anti-sigma factor [Casimicrobiaceae bacterium]|nr:anti-sigma factor [Casimicrobiaceae bacterium]